VKQQSMDNNDIEPWDRN